MSQRNQPPRSQYDRPDDELERAIDEIETLESDRPSFEVNITGSHPAIVPHTGPGEPPKRSLIPRQLDTPLKKLAALLATLIIAGVSAVVAEIIQRITSK